ncbi:MAG: UDP-N-acetylglucosamine 2-epimerase (non-hydrolyzing) [Defluviitaleaceae bacterium]|nr:UDP-N-acetylglucosamine 2-epimerase (non-hydrolyzing) [Defluviitaleaceae bacterium]
MNKKLKIAIVFGTRPEAIKMAPLIKALENEKNLEPLVIVTGQHRKQLDQVLLSFNILPKYDLNIMKENQTLIDISTRTLSSLDTILKKEIPDLVLVHGDTTTSFVAALCAFYNNLPIGHVEAGLRSFNKKEPYPEEANRKLISTIADLHFAPTSLSKQNLIKENITENIFVTGNTAIDAISYTENYIFENKDINKLNFEKKIILITAHRRENLGEPLEDICKAILELAKKYKNIYFVYPMHQNPKIRDKIFSIFTEIVLNECKNIILTDSISTKDMHNLLNRTYIVLTDSGGLQEEAPFFNVPVLVLRNVTERPEGIDSGVLKIVGTNKENIIKNTCNLLENKEEYENMKSSKNPYGDGNAATRIAEFIKYYFGLIHNKPCEF